MAIRDEGRSSGTAAVMVADAVDEQSSASAVSWAAIIGGAVAAVATTLILLVLGTGLGLTMVSPWYRSGASAATVGVTAIIWLVVVQWLSSAIGGYLAGRLRTKWVHLHTDEVFFRDTAHGFLAWGLASVAGALVFATVSASGVGGAARGAADIASGAASGAAQAGMQRTGSQNMRGGGDGSGYYVDTLFRSTVPADAGKGDVNGETARILARSTQHGQIALSPDDRTYLAQTVAARTGLSEADAETRVDTVVKQMNDTAQQARQAADTARKRAAQIAIVTALAMVLGAFIASAAGALGGRLRDEY